MENVKVFFVLPENCTQEDQASEVMLQAFESCRQNVINVSWIEESKIKTKEFCKTDFVVFQEFKGQNFEWLKQSKCARILGPWCLLICLMKGIPIPNFTWPIYNVAMVNCVVSCSHLGKTKKLEIKQKVQLMGGCYADDLMSANTHLITESVKSEKYLRAAETGQKLFVSNWVDAVWEASQTSNVHCDDEQFLKYRCFPFHNLTISSTGFSLLERNQLTETVAKNGGVFTANLIVAKTDVLVVQEESGAQSKKYKVAKTNPNIYCVSINWINDSIAKGYAVAHNSYTINTKGTSTPSKADETVPDFSILSAIGDTTSRGGFVVEESVLPKRLEPTKLFASRISPNKRKCSTSDISLLIDGVDIKKAKRAGQYLDGCSVYLAGFKPDQREKLSKILNLSGATRYDDISDRLTHIIIGDSTCPEARMIKAKNYSVSMVSIHWLLASIEHQKIADEENYLISLHDSERDQFSSPLGKKGLSLLRTSKTLTSNESSKTTPIANSRDTEVDDELVQQYLKSSAQEDSDTLAKLLNNHSLDFKNHTTEKSQQTINENNESSSNTLETENASSMDINIFSSKSFLVVNFSVEETQELKEQIESACGKIVSKTYKGIPDYVVAPPFITSPMQLSALETVNNYWIEQCVQSCQLLPIAYYHQPFVVCPNRPLEGCVVTISGYTSCERLFLRELVEALGGLSQDQFARVANAKKNVEAATHLISLEADGQKYMAALKWGLPVVKKEWLFECSKTGKLEREEEFLLGDAKAPSRNGNLSQSLNSLRKAARSPFVDRRTPTSAKSSKKVSTPLSQVQPLNVSTNENTPVNQRLFQGVSETPCTQVTPINKLMEEVRKTNLLGTPQTPVMAKTWYDVDTPESPFGAFIRPHLSPKSKKEILRYINGLPDFVPPRERRKSTPLSEVKRRCWAKLLGTEETSIQPPQNADQSCTNHSINETGIEGPNIDDGEQEQQTQDTNSLSMESNNFVNTKLKQIEEMMSAFSENRRNSRTFENKIPTETTEAEKIPSKDSQQPFTVGWDYEEHTQNEAQEVRIFMISGVENDQRQQLVDKIEQLGGQVSELSSYDPKCTHLICPKPARNEKTLACMASGKWILHVSYIEKCVAAGRFLPEEDFEFGNPKSKENIKISFDKENDAKLQAIHWWRKEISRRGYGAFIDMRAIVVAQKREPIIRVIEAGGGHIVEDKPPFNKDVHATHCLLEARTLSASDFTVYNTLAKQGILCINTLYISDFLHKTNKDIKDAIIPHFASFYSW